MTAVWILLGLVALVLLLLLISLVRTLFIPSRRSEYVPAPDPARTKEYADKLSRMVRVETVSVPGENQRGIVPGLPPGTGIPVPPRASEAGKNGN